MHLSSRERRDKVSFYLMRNMPQTEIAKKLGVSRQTIVRDVFSLKKASQNWLDDYHLKLQNAQEQVDKFGEEKSKIRKEAINRGREQVPEIIRKSLDIQFTKLHYDPYDIKPLLHPVEFVVFDGLNRNSLNNIVLLSRKPSNHYLGILQNAVAKTVEEKRYDWKVVRVSLEGKIEFE